MNRFRMKAALKFAETLELEATTVEEAREQVMQKYQDAVDLGEVPPGAFEILECVRVFEEEIVDGGGATATA